ncbi:MAG: HEAT repeat domain-containing protein [Chitinophagaceae bacterium]
MNRKKTDIAIVLHNKLQEGHNKEICDEVLTYIGDDKKKVNALVEIVAGNDKKLSQRASWALGYVGERNPDHLVPHLKQLLVLLVEPNRHPAIRRNITRALQYVHLPEDLHGIVMDTCFRFLEDPKEAAAVKAFSISILENLWYEYPEIGDELRIILTTLMEDALPSFKVRARRLLSLLG